MLLIPVQAFISKHTTIKTINFSLNIVAKNDVFKKGTPIHVKGALLYNHQLKQFNLGSKYPYIQEGDKIKFIKINAQLRPSAIIKNKIIGK